MTNENWNNLAPETRLHELKNMGAFFEKYEASQSHPASIEIPFQEMRTFFLRMELHIEPGVEPPCYGFDHFTWQVSAVENRIRCAGNLASNYFGLKLNIEKATRRNIPLLVSQETAQERYAKAEYFAERLYLRPKLGEAHGAK